MKLKYEEKGNRPQLVKAIYLGRLVVLFPKTFLEMRSYITKENDIG